MRIAEISSLVEAVLPKVYGGTQRVVSEKLVSPGNEVRLLASGASETAAQLVPITRRHCTWHPRIRIRDWLAPHITTLRASANAGAVWEIMRRVLLTAASLLALTRMSAAADPDISTHDEDLAAIRSLLPADHPEGIKATVTLVSLRLAPSLHNLVLSTFLIDYAPNGSAVLHRAPAHGYVLVHVLSGAIRARAWGAGLGTYRAGQTWTEPAFADDIASENASNDKPARALVVLVTTDVSPRELKGE
jgi:quercetin dioxygenase-like cupin family protein